MTGERNRDHRSRSRLPALVAVPLLLTLGCGGDDDTAPAIDAGPRADAPATDAPTMDAPADLDAPSTPDALELDAGPEGPAGHCLTRVTYRTTAAAPTVHVAGTFNGFDPAATPMLDDGTGTYVAELWLTPGVHAYKLVVEGDGAEPWRLDPANPYRAYHEGVENSGLRVPDCTRARFEPLGHAIDGTSASARFRFVPGRSGATLADGFTAELRTGRARTEVTAEVTSEVEGDVVTLRAEGLPEGKHLFAIAAADEPAALAPFWIEAAPFAWDDAFVYVLMPDRFRNADRGSDAAPTDASAGADFEGGDLQGVTEAIEAGYFEHLGVNTLWLTPWHLNPDHSELAGDDVHRVTGYHGYWPTDPFEVDPRFGGEDALHGMIEAAHRHGIRVLMDLVINHVHEEHPYFRDHPEWFNRLGEGGCVCGTAECDWTARRLDCLFRPYMPDVDWTVLEAQEQLLDDAMIWMEDYDLDGFRVDAVKHVPDSVVYNLRVRVAERFEASGTDAFLMGETAMGWDAGSGPDEGGNVENYETIRRYVGDDALDGQFDFVLYYAASLQFLRDEPGRGMAHVDFWTQASMRQFGDAIMTPYVGSHDTARFVSLQSDPGRAWRQWDDLPSEPSTDEPYDRMYVALGWMLSLPGAPLLYYGDEYGQFGGSDPDNRRLMRFGGPFAASLGDALGPREEAQLARVSALGRARAELPGLRSRRYRTLYVDEDTSVVARGEGEDVVLVVIHRAAGPRNLTVPVPAEVATGTLTDALGRGAATIRGGAIDLSLAGRSIRYYAR